jgi:hypothetical protein
MSGLPRCFGTEFDLEDKQCTGGHDPEYTDPETGKHEHEKCDLFDGCKAEMMCGAHGAQVKQRLETELKAAKAELKQIKETACGTTTTKASTSTMQRRDTQITHGSGMPVDYRIPQYLSKLEPQRHNRKWTCLGAESARSAGKAIGHTLAHFFDTVSFTDEDDEE